MRAKIPLYKVKTYDIIGGCLEGVMFNQMWQEFLSQVQNPSWQWILSQVLSLCALVLLVLGIMTKRKSMTVGLMAASFLLMAAATILLENYIIAAISLVALVRNIAYLLTEKYQAKLPKWFSHFVLATFMVITAATLSLIIVFLESWWLDWILLGLGLFIVYGTWAKGIHLIRLSNLSYTVVVIVNHLVFTNLVGVAMEIIFMVSIFAFYVKYFRAKRVIARIESEDQNAVQASQEPIIQEPAKVDCDIHSPATCIPEVAS